MKYEKYVKCKFLDQFWPIILKKNEKSCLICDTFKHRHAVEIQVQNTLNISDFFLEMTGCDTPGPRDADASKKYVECKCMQFKYLECRKIL